MQCLKPARAPCSAARGSLQSFTRSTAPCSPPSVQSLSQLSRGGAQLATCCLNDLTWERRARGTEMQSSFTRRAAAGSAERTRPLQSGLSWLRFQKAPDLSDGCAAPPSIPLRCVTASRTALPAAGGSSASSRRPARKPHHVSPSF